MGMYRLLHCYLELHANSFVTGVFGPILLHKWMPNKLNLLFVVLKQFGTGIIISTAFVHVSRLTALLC